MASLLIRQLPLLNGTTGEAENINNHNNNIWIIKTPQYVQYDLKIISKFKQTIFAKESTETYLSWLHIFRSQLKTSRVDSLIFAVRKAILQRSKITLVWNPTNSGIL